ncbi:MAG: hypothetical protein RI953_2122 [Pseudomonadota bacterium]
MVIARLKRCWMKATGGALLLALCGFLTSACSKSAAGKVYLLGESRVVSGSVGQQAGLDFKAVKISLVDNQGFRTDPFDLKYSSSQGTFSFQLRDTDLYEPKNGTGLDRILSMGNALPLVTSGDPDIVGKVDKYTRVEIMQNALADQNFQIVPYFQGVIPLSRRNLLAGKDVIGVDGKITFSKAGFVRVKVTDAAGKALAGVKVAGVADGKILSGAPLWHDTLLRPVFQTTNESGVVFVGPLDASVELTRYQILALAEGYCTFLSAPTYNFSLAEKTAPAIKLTSCEKSTTVNELVPSFPEGLKYFDINSRKTVHTNSDSIFLRLDAKSEKLRGVKVAVYEANSNYEPSLEPSGEVREAQTFQGEFSITLPKIFKLTDTTEGRFIIKVSRMAGALDGGELSAESFPELIVYGHKKVGAPSRETLMKVNLGATPDISDDPSVSVDDWLNLKITSATGGATNVVSGLPGGKFTMVTPKVNSDYICSKGDELGFAVPTYRMSLPVFKECVNGVATFTSEEAGFVANAALIAQYGGRQKWFVYIKDKFGNISEKLDDPEAISPKRLNVVTVIVDTARPLMDDVDSLSDGVPLGSLKFYKDGVLREAESTALTPSDIALGAITFGMEKTGAGGSEGTCIQTSATSDEESKNGQLGGNATFLNSVSGFIFRDDLARLVFKSKDSTTGLYEEVGLLIYDWTIAATSASASASTAYTRCRTLLGTNPEPNLRELKEGDIAFPVVPTAPAEFYMRYRDVAGNLSNPIKYSIPACTPGMSSLCWKN